MTIHIHVGAPNSDNKREMRRVQVGECAKEGGGMYCTYSKCTRMVWSRLEDRRLRQKVRNTGF